VVLRGIHTEDGDDVSYLVHFTESEVSVHSFVWFVSLACAVLPLTTNSYGQAGMWCWIKDSDDIQNVSTLWRFVTFYFVVWFGFIISSVVYYYVFKALRLVIRMSQSTIDGDFNVEVLLRLMRTLKFYPIIFLTSWVPLTTYRVVETIYPSVQNDKNITFTFVILNGSSLQGILTAIAFVTTPSVRRHWYGYLCGVYNKPIGDYDCSDGSGDGGGGGGDGGSSADSSNDRQRGRRGGGGVKQKSTIGSKRILSNEYDSVAGQDIKPINASDDDDGDVSNPVTGERGTLQSPLV
jgi:hypothetical protein